MLNLNIVACPTLETRVLVVDLRDSARVLGKLLVHVSQKNRHATPTHDLQSVGVNRLEGTRRRRARETERGR